MTIPSTAALVEALRHHQLLSAPQLDEVTQTLQPRFQEPLDLARDLLHRDWLTAYQVNQLFRGQGQELQLGSYLLLERLGEGGMGKVFKARHQKLERVVALKVIHQRCLDHRDVIPRFYREMQLAAQLSHPNIVFAYDADHVNDTHFLAMEYVDGIGLGRLVELGGPPAVARACDLMRQAALGLQHAFERGLVHRDLKPSNLLVTRPPTNLDQPGGDGATAGPQGLMIKIIDFGLARLQSPEEGRDRPRRITQLGKTVGTPDFMAPEQGKDAQAADIRSDLYSLGCTFYFLLTGQVPFPTGNTEEKVRQHRSREPMRLEKLRPEVPAGIVGIVRKLMAKRRRDRFQEPAQLVEALEPFLPIEPGSTPGGPGVARRREVSGPRPLPELMAPGDSGIFMGDTVFQA